MRPIGVIHSPFTEKKQTPIQASRSQARGTIEVDQKFMGGLQDLEGFSHIFILYAFHNTSGYSLRVKPFLDHKERGLFSTRYPRRPNQIGLSVVQLLAVDGNRLTIKASDGAFRYSWSRPRKKACQSLGKRSFRKTRSPVPQVRI